MSSMFLLDPDIWGYAAYESDDDWGVPFEYHWELNRGIPDPFRYSPFDDYGIKSKRQRRKQAERKRPQPPKPKRKPAPKPEPAVTEDPNELRLVDVLYAVVRSKGSLFKFLGPTMSIGTQVAVTNASASKRPRTQLPVSIVGVSGVDGCACGGSGCHVGDDEAVADDVGDDSDPVEIPCAYNSVDSVTALFNDKRVSLSNRRCVHSDILRKALSYITTSVPITFNVNITLPPTGSNNMLRCRHINTIPIVASACKGIAVNSSETLMAVTCNKIGDEGNKLYVYSLPGGELLKTIGEKGSEPGQFHAPGRVCFGPDDVIIVADVVNNRLQEFSTTGVFKRGISTGGETPHSLSISHDKRMIAVGVEHNSVLLIDYSSGRIRTTVCASGNSSSNKPRRHPCIVHSVCFSVDDGEVLMCSARNGEPYTSAAYSVTTGKHVRPLPFTTKPRMMLDMSYTHDNELVTIANRQHSNTCVNVYDSEGRRLLREWNRKLTPDTKLWALAYVNRRLYVLDFAAPRVLVLG